MLLQVTGSSDVPPLAEWMWSGYESYEDKANNGYADGDMDYVWELVWERAMEGNGEYER